MMEETTYEPIDLKDTVTDMCSEDYKERFRAEYIQLAIRYNRLKNIVDGCRNGVIDYTTLSCPATVLIMQLDDMWSYRTVLEARAAIEGIDLPKIY